MHLSPPLSLALPLHVMVMEEIAPEKTQGQAKKRQVVSARCMQRQAQLEFRRARAFRVRAIRARQLAKENYEDVVSMQQQAIGESGGRLLAIKVDVDHGADFDSIRYVLDSLAGDSYVLDSFKDVEEEASVAAEREKEREKNEKALAIVRPMMYKIWFPSFPELHE